MIRKCFLVSGAVFLASCVMRLEFPVPGKFDKAKYLELREKAVADGDQESRKLLASKYVYEQGHELSSRATMQLRNVITALGSPSDASSSEIRILITVDDDPYAISYPNGLIIIASSLIAQTGRFGTTDHALFGLIAHEVGHITNEHVVNQWISAAPGRASAAVGLVNPFAFLSRIRGSESIPTTLEPRAYEKAIEFAADSHAASLLLRTNQPLADYIALLKTLNDFSKQNSSTHGWLSERAQALMLLSTPGNKPHRFSALVGQESVELTLSNSERYALYLFSTVHLSATDAKKIMAWLSSDGTMTLDEISPGVQPELRVKITQLVLGFR